MKINMLYLRDLKLIIEKSILEYAKENNISEMQVHVGVGNIEHKDDFGSVIESKREINTEFEIKYFDNRTNKELKTHEYETF